VHPVAGLLHQLDAVQDVVLGLLAEAPDTTQLLGLDGLHQLVDRRHVQLLVQLHRLLRPQRGYRGERPDAGRDLRPGLVDRLHAAGPEVLDHLLRDRRADVGDLAQLLDVHPGHVGVVPTDGPGRLLVHPCLERVLAGDQDEVGVLLQQRLDLLVGSSHGAEFRGCPPMPALGAR